MRGTKKYKRKMTAGDRENVKEEEETYDDIRVRNRESVLGACC